MIIRHYRIRNDQFRALKQLPGQESEHVRAAIDDYLVKKNKQIFNVSYSASSAKGGDNGHKTNEPSSAQS